LYYPCGNDITITVNGEQGKTEDLIYYNGDGIHPVHAIGMNDVIYMECNDYGTGDFKHVFKKHDKSFLYKGNKVNDYGTGDFKHVFKKHDKSFLYKGNKVNVVGTNSHNFLSSYECFPEYYQVISKYEAKEYYTFGSEIMEASVTVKDKQYDEYHIPFNNGDKVLVKEIWGNGFKEYTIVCCTFYDNVFIVKDKYSNKVTLDQPFKTDVSDYISLQSYGTLKGVRDDYHLLVDTENIHDYSWKLNEDLYMKPNSDMYRDFRIKQDERVSYKGQLGKIVGYKKLPKYHYAVEFEADPGNRHKIYWDELDVVFIN
jgi:hypothetical protein